MYRTCLHCHGPLGANEVVEHFPIGRRLAFDSAKGRLWVVCGKCGRWNLTPLEERWEAIEECEREFSRTRLRASTDNIAIARVPAGLDLVRVGSPKFPELAAWRYGTSLRQRWMTRALPVGVLSFSGFAGQLLNSANIIGFGASMGLVGVVMAPTIFYVWWRSRVRVMLPDRSRITVSHFSPRTLALEPDEQSGWALRIGDRKSSALATGTVATHSMRGILTAMNFFGGHQKQIDGAIAMLNASGDPSRFLARVAAAGRANKSESLKLLPPDVRLGLEMALHDQAERRALEGELAALREEWQMAEDIAQIADDMFLPESVQRRIDALIAPKSP
jgi:hypothetical protein